MPDTWGSWRLLVWGFSCQVPLLRLFLLFGSTEHLLFRPDLAAPWLRRATEGMGGAEPPGTTRSALREHGEDGEHRTFPVVSTVAPSVRVGDQLYGGNLFGGSIAPVTTRWYDCDECVEVEIDYGLKCLGGGTIAQAVGQRIMPSDILCLQLDQPGDGVGPTLSSGPSVVGNPRRAGAPKQGGPNGKR
jgi:hypothetical protein